MRKFAREKIALRQNHANQLGVFAVLVGVLAVLVAVFTILVGVLGVLCIGMVHLLLEIIKKM